MRLLAALTLALLALGASKLRRFMGPRLFRGINIVSGVSILAFAAWQVVVLLK